MKWWMLRVERRSHKQGGDIHPPPPSEQHSTRPPAFQFPLPSIFQLGIPNCHLRGSQIHIFCFSLLIPLCVFLTSVETNIFHIYEYIYIYAYIYIYIYIYEQKERREGLFRFLSSRCYLRHILFHFCTSSLCLFVLFYVYSKFICFTEELHMLCIPNTS